MRTHPEHAVCSTGPRSGCSADGLAIVLDSGELRSGLPALVQLRWERVSVRRLPVGDASVGRVLVERKEAHDFVQSLRSGRLFRQAYKLKGASPRPLVVLEGNPHSLVEPAQVPSLKGALLSLLTGYGIPVLRTPDLEGTAESLVRIAHQEARRSRGKARARALDPRVPQDHDLARAPPADPRALRILEALPDVGPVRARALLRRFGSLERLLSSDPAELVRTPGIGATTATRILSALLRAGSSLAHSGRGDTIETPDLGGPGQTQDGGYNPS